jgi:hypothetical protein
MNLERDERVARISPMVKSAIESRLNFEKISTSKIKFLEENACFKTLPKSGRKWQHSE